jgi:hypothetical protein
MISWVVINRQHPRQARQRRHVTKIPSPQPLCFLHLQNRDARDSFRFRSYAKCRATSFKPNVFLPRRRSSLDIQRYNSHFGTHHSAGPQRIAPLFSCAYNGQISQPLCFDIHTKCPGSTPLHCPNVPKPYGIFKCFRPIPFPFTPLRTLLRFFALAQNSTLLFSIDSALFVKKRGGTSFKPRACSLPGQFATSYFITSLRGDFQVAVGEHLYGGTD